jgi:hypothetical protein
MFQTKGICWHTGYKPEFTQGCLSPLPHLEDMAKEVGGLSVARDPCQDTAYDFSPAAIIRMNNRIRSREEELEDEPI